ncbi:ABC transporter permease [Halopiger goleimassiliensis]|uniref:ABC transporter permease n=1 Tax=Halopiger goleimassiliensis TaxID=1293048 RepID=UPI0006778F54|nr:ABC transporter permease subunit [Halopiger goleimassiliensis]
MSAIGRQYRLARRSLGIVASSPQVLLNPILFLIVGFTYPIVAYSVLGMGAFGWLFTFLTTVAVASFAWSFFMVGYIYELNELFDGREPSLGEGLGVAADRARMVGIAALVFGPGRYLLQSSVARIIPGADRFVGVGFDTASVFAFPIAALSPADQSLEDALSELSEAVRSKFGTAAFATVGIRAFAATLTLAGFVTAFGLLAAWIYQGVDIAVGPLGPFTLPILALFGCVTVAAVTVVIVSGIVRTALYRYAVDDELPPELGVDADDLVYDSSQIIDPAEAGRLAWVRLGAHQARRAAASLSLWVLAVSMAVLAALVTRFVVPFYESLLGDGIDAAREIQGQASLQEVAEVDELEALELVFGVDPSWGDVIGALEALQSSGDVFGVGLLSALVLSLGPMLGLLVTVPAILRGRRNGSYERLVEAGYSAREVVLGVFLGRLAAASVVIVVPALAIAGVVWNRQASVGLPYVVATLFAIACIGIFVALGVLVGSVAKGWISAAVGSLGVWLLPFVLSGNPLGIVGIPNRETVIEAVITPPWDFLPAVLTRFNLYNVITDGMHFATLSSVVDSLPRLSRVSLETVLTSDLPPQEAAAELPFYLHQYLAYPAVLLWIVVPLVAAVVWFDPEW